MADTVIVSPTSEPARIRDGSRPPVRWSCLARRGMVFSEIEGFEQVTVAAGATLQAPAHPYTEQMIFAVRGRAVADVAGARLHLEAGEVLMLGVGGPHTLTNDGGEPLELLSIEFIPTQIADRLPPRTPQLVDAA